MLVSRGRLGHGVDMHTSLVGEGRAADKGRPDVGIAVGQLVHEKGCLPETGEIGNNRDPHLQLQAGNDGGEVAVAGPLAVPVHRPLDLDGASTDGGKGVRRTHPAVIVGMDADLAGETGIHHGGDGGDLVRHRPPVGVAEHQGVGATLGRRGKGLERKLRVILVTVEEMLGIVEDLAPLGLQVGDALADHGEVLLVRHAEHLLHLELPAFSENRHHGRLRLQQLGDLGIIGHLDAGAAGASERGELRLAEIVFAGLGKEGEILGVRTGPSPLDVVHAEDAELLGDADLVQETEGDSLPLGPVAKGRVVKGDGSVFHRMENLNPEMPALQSRGISRAAPHPP